jgi:glutathione synthase/RimK-type ligase-like ATP-grasp enzyme
MNVVWVTDRRATLDADSDTTLRLMYEFARRPVQSYWSHPARITTGTAGVVIQAVSVGCDKSLKFSSRFITLRLSDVNLLVYRVNPPVDQSYILSLHTLSGRLGADVSGPVIVNDPRLLVGTNSKIEALNTGVAPWSVVTSSTRDLDALIRRHGKVVIKPLNRGGSRGVVFVGRRSRADIHAAFSRATAEHTIPAMVQSAIHCGLPEYRLWFVDGELVGCAFRRATHRGRPLNRLSIMSAGEIPSTVTTALRRYFSSRRIGFCAVDCIGDYVLEINFVSPGLVLEQERVAGPGLAHAVIVGLERMARANRAGTP